MNGLPGPLACRGGVPHQEANSSLSKKKTKIDTRGTVNSDHVASSDFALLLKQAAGGSLPAIQSLVETYSPHILRVVRRRIDQNLRRQYDSTDFLQMVWTSFFRELEPLTRFDEPAALGAFLVRIARNKVIDEVRRRRTLRHDICREEGLNTHWQEYAHDDTASRILVARERFDSILFRHASNDRDRDILLLRLVGSTMRDIARKMNLSERTVRRRLKNLEGSVADRSPLDADLE